MTLTKAGDPLSLPKCAQPESIFAFYGNIQELASGT